MKSNWELFSIAKKIGPMNYPWMKNAQLLPNIHRIRNPRFPVAPMLYSDQLLSDPRVAQAKELLRSALEDYSKRIDGVCGPSEDLQPSYLEMLSRLAVARGGAPYFPYISSGLGNGPFIQLGDGSIKLDFIVGIGVHGLGHSHPELLMSTVDAGLEDTVMQGNLQHDAYSLAMCEKLIAMGNAHGAPLKHCLLSTSGAMANENALKIAFHSRFPASRVICMDNCFAGRSLALAQLTDRPAYRTGLPKTLDVDFVPMFHPSDAEGTTRGAIEMLRKLIQRHPGEYACLWLELVAGEGGYYPGTHEYFSNLCEICHENNILVIFDEVQTFSRLSQPFAFQHFGLDRFADIVSLGKITQVCATLYGESLKPRGPILSQTFTGSTASIRAGLAVLHELEKHHCFGPNGWNMERHRYFAAKLESLGKTYPGKISGPYGEGMMIAFTPGDGSAETAKSMLQRLYDLGLMGFLAGSNPNRIRFLPPPGITSEHHIDLACNIIEQAIAN